MRLVSIFIKVSAMIFAQSARAVEYTTAFLQRSKTPPRLFSIWH